MILYTLIPIHFLRPKPSLSVIVRDARITLGLADILQEGAIVHLDVDSLDLLLVVDEEHVDAADGQGLVVALPAPGDAGAGVEHVERVDAGEGRLRALTGDELLLGREADGAERRLLEVVDAVRVVGEVVGEQGVGERQVEVCHRVLEHIDEAVNDRLGVGVAEAELGRARGRGGNVGAVALPRWPTGYWRCEGDAGECQGHDDGYEMHGVGGFLNECARRFALIMY